MVPVAAKVGALLAVAAAGSTSVWYFSDSIFGSPLVSIADENPSTSYDNKSIGKNYSKYFLSSKNNKKTWEKRYKERQDRFSGGGANKAKDKFGTVTEGYSDTESNTTTSLNKICEEAYKLTESGKLLNDESTGSSGGTDKFAIPNIWKFCSIGGIVTVGEDTDNYKEDTSTTSKIGWDNTNKKIFISAKSEKNQWFWKLREEEFRKESGDRSHSKSQGKEQDGNVFKTLKNDQTKTLSETCHSAYEKTTSDDKKNKEDALIFCSIQLTIPTDSQA